MVFCAAINCSNNSKSGISTFKFPENAKLRKEWLIKMKRESFQPTKHLVFVQYTLLKTVSNKIWQ